MTQIARRILQRCDVLLICGLMICLTNWPDQVNAAKVALTGPDFKIQKPTIIDQEEASNSSKVLKRDKRFLLFTVAGISKCVLGFLTPVETRDKVNWRTMNMAYNFHAQYVPLPTPIWPWNIWGRALVENREKFDREGNYTQDGTRGFVYTAIEVFLSQKGRDGHQCLLKAICEAAQQPVERTGVFEEIIHLVLTPNKDEAQSEYLDARYAGEFGADCSTIYQKCPPGQGLLESISYFI